MMADATSGSVPVVRERQNATARSGSARGLLEAVAELVRERHQLTLLVAELTGRVAALEAREREIARRMYRRGYLAGRAAQRRGAPAVTNPEHHARGELPRILSQAGERP